MEMSGRRGVGDRFRQRVLRHLDQPGERSGVGHRKLGEHAPVHVNPGGLQALDEPVVGNAVRAGGSVDALDPQPAEGALAVLAARIGVRHRVEHLLLGLAVHPRPLAAVPARPLKHHPALLVGVDRPLHACHVLLPGGGLGYLASNYLIFLASAGASSTSPASRLVTLLGLCSNRCLRFARRRSTFPVPVSRKRLFAPLCVFIFGMLAVVFRLLRAFGAALSCVPPRRGFPPGGTFAFHDSGLPGSGRFRRTAWLARPAQLRALAFGAAATRAGPDRAAVARAAGAGSGCARASSAAVASAVSAASAAVASVVSAASAAVASVVSAASAASLGLAGGSPAFASGATALARDRDPARSPWCASRLARSARASLFLRCGPITMIMLRPSCRGCDSTNPSSSTSPARRCRSRKPSSGRDCSRPRNMIVTLTLSPCRRNRSTC